MNPVVDDKAITDDLKDIFSQGKQHKIPLDSWSQQF
jgi:hypothetical protein